MFPFSSKILYACRGVFIIWDNSSVILFNEKLNDYTLKEEIENIKSIKQSPIKFKFNDSTSRFRKEILKTEMLEKNHNASKF